MLTGLIVVIITQYVEISNHFVTHLKHEMLYVNYMSIFKLLVNKGEKKKNIASASPKVKNLSLKAVLIQWLITAVLRRNNAEGPSQLQSPCVMLRPLHQLHCSLTSPIVQPCYLTTSHILILKTFLNKIPALESLSPSLFPREHYIRHHWSVQFNAIAYICHMCTHSVNFS